MIELLMAVLELLGLIDFDLKGYKDASVYRVVVISASQLSAVFLFRHLLGHSFRLPLLSRLGNSDLVLLNPSLLAWAVSKIWYCLINLAIIFFLKNNGDIDLGIFYHHINVAPHTDIKYWRYL